MGVSFKVVTITNPHLLQTPPTSPVSATLTLHYPTLLKIFCHKGTTILPSSESSSVTDSSLTSTPSLHQLPTAVFDIAKDGRTVSLSEFIKRIRADPLYLARNTVVQRAEFTHGSPRAGDLILDRQTLDSEEPDLLCVKAIGMISERDYFLGYNGNWMPQSNYPQRIESTAQKFVLLPVKQHPDFVVTHDINFPRYLNNLCSLHKEGRPLLPNTCATERDPLSKDKQGLIVTYCFIRVSILVLLHSFISSFL